MCPILTTTLVAAAISFTPMDISTRRRRGPAPAGHDVIGGILSSTALMLVVLPLVLWRLLRKRA